MNEWLKQDGVFATTKPPLEVGTDPNKAALDAFGLMLMQWVRDRAITDMDRLIEGRMRGLIAERFPNIASSFTEEQLALVQRLVAETVDATLHHLLWTLDQIEWVDVAVHTQAGTVPSLRMASDGLYGDLYDWAPRFSKQRYEPKA